jgi:polyisoprenoid-binding protein YceI
MRILKLKKMKKLNFFVAASAVAMMVVSCGSPETVEATDAVAVEAVESSAVYALAPNQQIEWEGHKPFVENYGHYGTININNGSIAVEGDAIVGGSFEIDMNSIHAIDMEGNEKYDNFIGHLKSDDFFAVANFPTSSFEITSVTASANDELGTTHRISGNLTMRDQTKNITFDAIVTMTDDMVSITAPGFQIDRKNWNVMFGSTGIAGLAKDKLIADNIGLKFAISGKKA